VQALERRLLPEAVEHAVGESLQIGPLDDPAQDLPAWQHRHPLIVHLHIRSDKEHAR